MSCLRLIVRCLSAFLLWMMFALTFINGCSSPDSGDIARNWRQSDIFDQSCCWMAPGYKYDIMYLADSGTVGGGMSQDFTVYCPEAYMLYFTEGKKWQTYQFMDQSVYKLKMETFYVVVTDSSENIVAIFEATSFFKHGLPDITPPPYPYPLYSKYGVVGGNNSIQSASQPKTDGNAGQKR